VTVNHPERPTHSPFRTILLGGLAIGTLDILWAIVMNAIQGKSPVWVLQSVAGGLLGSATFDGGARTAVLGTLIHYGIATTVMATFYLVSRRVPMLARRPFLFGPIYGVVVYVVMYQLVLPLSAWHTSGIKVGAGLAKGLFIHLFGIGLVAALMTRWGDRAAEA
jgi:hypothetical protein